MMPCRAGVADGQSGFRDPGTWRDGEVHGCPQLERRDERRDVAGHVEELQRGRRDSKQRRPRDCSDDGRSVDQRVAAAAVGTGPCVGQGEARARRDQSHGDAAHGNRARRRCRYNVADGPYSGRQATTDQNGMAFFDDVTLPLCVAVTHPSYDRAVGDVTSATSTVFRLMPVLQEVHLEFETAPFVPLAQRSDVYRFVLTPHHSGRFVGTIDFDRPSESQWGCMELRALPTNRLVTSNAAPAFFNIFHPNVSIEGGIAYELKGGGPISHW
jgi:hypothetical protein